MPRKRKPVKINEYFDDEYLSKLAGTDELLLGRLKDVRMRFGKFAYSKAKLKEYATTLKAEVQNAGWGAAISDAKSNWSGDRRKFNNVKVKEQVTPAVRTLDDDTTVLDATRLSNGMLLVYVKIQNPWSYDSPWYTYQFRYASELGL